MPRELFESFAPMKQRNPTWLDTRETRCIYIYYENRGA
jgi:hypothetical protein